MEKEIEDIIVHTFRTSPEVEWWKEAAHAIAERMKAGVIWEGEGKVWKMGDNYEYLDIVVFEDERLVDVQMKPDDGKHKGQRVRVTVTKLEGEDADKGMD